MEITSDRSEHSIWIAGDGAPSLCASDERVLDALERDGCEEVRVGCRRGGCGACRVRIVSGEYETIKMSRAHVSAEDRERGYALSCRLFPRSDLVLEPAYVGPKRVKKDNA